MHYISTNILMILANFPSVTMPFFWKTSVFTHGTTHNQHVDKLATARADFKQQSMLQGACLSWILSKLGVSKSFCW